MKYIALTLENPSNLKHNASRYGIQTCLLSLQYVLYLHKCFFGCTQWCPYTVRLYRWSWALFLQTGEQNTCGLFETGSHKTKVKVNTIWCTKAPCWTLSRCSLMWKSWSSNVCKENQDFPDSPADLVQCVEMSLVRHAENFCLSAI